MADSKKYYYMRLKENFFDDDAMQILESMHDGYLYSNILLKLYLKSLKSNGRLMFNDRIPYNAQVLATITRHQVGTVEKALKVFSDLGLIEVLDNGAIYMLDVQNYIGKSSTEADRVRNCRQKIEGEKKMLESGNVQMSEQMYDEDSYKCTPEIELEKEIKLERENIDYLKIIHMYNETCVSFPTLQKLSESRKKAIKARLNTGYSYDDFKTLFEKAEASTFLKGGNDRNWSATFDWLINGNNMAKVLDGNYGDKKTNQRSDSAASEFRKGGNTGGDNRTGTDQAHAPARVLGTLV